MRRGYRESNLFLARAVAFFDVYFSEIYTQIGYFVEGMRLLLITNHPIKSLAIFATAKTFSQRYCMKCKEDRKENVRNKIVNAKRRRKKLCAEN